MTIFKCNAPVIQSQGTGYYNYYNIESRYKTTKPSEVWYLKDLSKQEISSNNTGVQNKDSEDADLYRKLESVYKGIAEANRARYSSVEELQNALAQKYSSNGAYAKYSKEQRDAMYINELSMTCFGTIGDATGMGGGCVLADPHLNGQVTANSRTDTKAFNEKTLSMQLSNVFLNNGINTALFGNAKFSFSIDGMTKHITVSLLANDEAKSISDALLEQMEAALNTNNNAKNLFYNMLYHANHMGNLKVDERAKYLLYNDFYQETVLDIRKFIKVQDGFVDKAGNYARDLYNEALKTSSNIPSQFKGAAYNYFLQLEQNALKYDLSKVADLTLSMVYQSGCVMLDGANTNFDSKI